MELCQNKKSINVDSKNQNEVDNLNLFKEKIVNIYYSIFTGWYAIYLVTEDQNFNFKQITLNSSWESLLNALGDSLDKIGITSKYLILEIKTIEKIVKTTLKEKDFTIENLRWKSLMEISSDAEKVISIIIESDVKIMNTIKIDIKNIADKSPRVSSDRILEIISEFVLSTFISSVETLDTIHPAHNEDTKLICSKDTKVTEVIPIFFVYISRKILKLLIFMLDKVFMDDERSRRILCKLQDAIWLKIDELNYNNHFTPTLKVIDLPPELGIYMPLDLQKLFLSYLIE
jgi:hypothetical protein